MAHNHRHRKSQEFMMRKKVREGREAKKRITAKIKSFKKEIIMVEGQIAHVDALLDRLNRGGSVKNENRAAYNDVRLLKLRLQAHLKKITDKLNNLEGWPKGAF